MENIFEEERMEWLKQREQEKEEAEEGLELSNDYCLYCGKPTDGISALCKKCYEELENESRSMIE